MSADPESISSGRSFPQWLRTKTDNKFDFDSSAISPPSHDDSFFYIRYPTGVNDGKKQYSARGLNSISDAITTSTIETKPIKQTNEGATNMVQHTEPCKKFLNNKDRELTIDNVKHPPKPFGTDDGFKGAGAACGSSIVKVAHQMVSAKSLARGFTVAKFSKDAEEVNAEQSSDESSFAKPHFLMKNHLDDDLAPPSRLMGRRGSKSLPASPLGSPKTLRRNPNPYFTGTFTMAAMNPSTSGASTTENVGRGWFLSSLLGVQREATSSTSVSHISEETEEQLEMPQPKPVAAPQKLIKAKPSELREMNFWSPTSM